MKRWVLILGGAGEPTWPIRRLCEHLGYCNLDRAGYGLVIRAGDATAHVAAETFARYLATDTPLSTALREVVPAGGEPAFPSADVIDGGADPLGAAIAHADALVLVGEPPPDLRARVGTRPLLPVGGASEGAAALLEELIRDQPARGAFARARLEDLRDPLSKDNDVIRLLAHHLCCDFERSFAPPAFLPSGRRVLTIGGEYHESDAFNAVHLGRALARDGHALLLLGARSATDAWLEPVVADAHARALAALDLAATGMARQVVREGDEPCTDAAEVHPVPRAPFTDLREAIKQADAVFVLSPVAGEERRRELETRSAEARRPIHRVEHRGSHPAPRLLVQRAVDELWRSLQQATPADTPRTDAREPLRIVFLSANPSGTRPLALDRELEAIRASLHRAGILDGVTLASDLTARYEDLRALLLHHRPHVLHFSGHGTGSDGILLADDEGGQRPVAADALGALFAALREHVRVVVLNACYSEPQARAIAAAIGCAVGMRRSIRDEAAIAFSGGFYAALAAGESVAKAFEVGRAGIVHADADQPRSDAGVPELLRADGADPAAIVLRPR